MDYYKINNLLHGGDYNVEQWLDRPDILAEDIRLMKKAGVNVVTLGVFSWACLEPQENVYTFEWLDKVMDSMYDNDIYVILATPSGGKPPWMVRKYPEIMRTNKERKRLLYGERENQCNSNEIFRSKVREIDDRLASRYANHPALIMWHISNEMYGQCHCQKCQENFRGWLKDKYKTIDNLNKEYWSKFWSHTYNTWSELESPAPHGETGVHGLALDYNRFYSDLSIDFLNMEIGTIRKYNKKIPVTSNMFHLNCGINYGKLAEILDVISWDSYPTWHCGTDKSSEWSLALEAAFRFDFCRSLKQQPFLLMESTPSTTNGFAVSKIKKPGMHMLSSLQAIAGGSDSVQYFQWRQSLGAYEKFHGAVLTHNGSEDTRVYREVAEVGDRLKTLSYLKNTTTNSSVAIIYDWENLRALEEQKNLRRNDKGFEEIVREHYEALIKNYVSVDVIDQTADLSSYELVVAPMLYLFMPGTPDKIRKFVANGGTFVMTFYSGVVNENDLAFECFPPFSLNEVFGIKSEEIDCLCDGEYNQFTYQGKKYKAFFYCDIIHSCDAQVLSEYECDFYEGGPVLTLNKYEEGAAYYLACRAEKDFLYDFYHDLIHSTGVRRIVNSEFIKDVMVKERTDGENTYKFFMNYSSESRVIQNINLKKYDFVVKKSKIQ
ncbi:MAG: beta-galactosidase [Anaerocolumna sp.]|nr:beta-galactosidase [Anaerocolumna sp.]